MTTADADCPHKSGHPWCLPSCEVLDARAEAANNIAVIPDRRRPLRDHAAAAAGALTDAEKASLVVYWASVAPAAFLLCLEAYEADTRW